jgi:triosephosphate isomerase
MPSIDPNYLLHRSIISEKVTVAAAAAVAGAAASVLYINMNSKRPKGYSTEIDSDCPRRYLIGGNWKCHGTWEENAARIQVLNNAGPIPTNVDVILCVPFLHIAPVLASLRDDIEVGAQDCGKNTGDGAYTGEVGAHQLVDIGCTWVIVGHSERRAGFGIQGETPDLCAQKCKVALDKGLKVMFAIGEQKEDRESGDTMKVCAAQLEPLVKLLEPGHWEKIAIAYEPVWAIGTGLSATPEMAQETHASIRGWISENVSSAVAAEIRIQYGGSMKGENAAELLKQPDIDGGLIGSASLKADFLNVINSVPKK